MRNGLCALALLAAGCSLRIGGFGWDDDPNVWVEDVQRYETAADGVTSVQLRTHSGRVGVTGEPQGSMVEIVAHIKAGGEDEQDAQACLDAVRVSVTRTGDAVRAGWSWEPRREDGWQAQVAFEVRQPEHLAVRAVTHNGRIVIADVGSDCHAETHNGDVELVQCAGEWVVETHNGAIEASGAAGEIDLVTHNGRIVARVSDAQNVKGRVETHNGSVRVALPAEAATRLVCTTGNGAIDVEPQFEHSERSRRRFEGQRGKPQGTLRVVTYNGSIRLTDT